ncbi:tetratricopeptide repeat protein [Pseudoalteromonas sp. OOF1S-7]|uniref:tetratricopeptide repeat protein n=1 Tax=Pseudoalteromonas sp. OOF1S-7 TaxID=2917757 RepID=UPI001EF48F8F|nr:tetratricopeptide repeat protein [Pseudoalteromonas sp. OOF1S-7]MCG7537532.1 tetratricopeptide repeat protein [Pseudoalteromonas sp. OOF1S-7]
MMAFSMMLLTWALAVSTQNTCTLPVELFKTQATNQPHQAIQTYLNHKQSLRRTLCADTTLVYRYLLMAATREQNWPLVEEAAMALQSTHLASDVEGKELNIINNIGVAYRKAGQPQDALAHYRCALTYARTHDTRALIKINIAIVHRNIEQPAIGFRLLEGIDEGYLPSVILAGLHVAKGNTALQLKRYDEALRAYQQARNHYLKIEDRRNAQAVVANMLVVALATNDLGNYDRLRPQSTLDLGLLTDHGQRFVNWLDTFRSYNAANNLSQTQQQQLQDIQEIAADYREFVVLLSARFGLNQDVALRTRNKSHHSPLSGALAKHWCPSL